MIIWLDHYIGGNDTCVELKEKLSNAIDIGIDDPLKTHEIDELIQDIHLYTKQLFLAQTVEECLTLIDRNYHKKIFLIISGSLGYELVSRVITVYPY